jgi:GxxExxY protein
VNTAEDTEDAEGRRLDEITGAVVVAAMKIHTALGPGLLESVCEKCLKHELSKRGLRVQTQVWLPVAYEGMLVDGGYKIDVLVEEKVVVELKVVEKLLEIHKAQLLSYLKLSGHRVGLLINFNVVHLREGVKRLINSRKVYPGPMAKAVNA